MRQLIVRFLNVAVIAAVLIGYNTVLDKRDKEDQIARLSAELEIIEAQSADVDTISGATFSSTGIRNAAQEAIEKAEK